MATVIVQQQTGRGLLIRAMWFLFVGWWLSAVVIVVAYVAAITVVGLPLAFFLFNRIPAVTTLRSRSQEMTATVVGGATLLKMRMIPQRPTWFRALYFVLVGWWLGLAWLSIAWLCSVLIITLPFAVLMYDRIGAVMTLLRY